MEKIETMASERTRDDPTFRVLFVCIGNICRSPSGERLLRRRLPADRFVVESAGVNGLEGQPMAARAAAELEALGIDTGGFVARRLTDPMVRAADLVLAATGDIRSRLLADTPSALRRSFTVREFAALLDAVEPADGNEATALRDLVARAAAARSRVRLEDPDIPDPYRRSAEAYAVAARLMAEAVDRIAAGLGA
ncbi:MAG: hypothetical protein ACTHJH_03345 [Marmoricola sp.]